MNEGFKRHIPVIAVVILLGLVTGCFAFSQIRAGVPSMDAKTFSTAIIIVPCIIMFVCSVVITITAYEISRELYATVVLACLVCGLASVVVTTFWTSDASIVQALLANSQPDDTVPPIANSPLVMIRDLAAFIVVPTVGCILGAWVGSRLHPMRAARKKR